MIMIEDRPKDAEVCDLYRLFLMLHHVFKAFCNATPNHVEKSESLAMHDIRHILRYFLLALFSFWVLYYSWILDEGQIELVEVGV